jgi:hypothetical protein
MSSDSNRLGCRDETAAFSNFQLAAIRATLVQPTQLPLSFLMDHPYLPLREVC